MKVLSVLLVIAGLASANESQEVKEMTDSAKLKSFEGDHKSRELQTVIIRDGRSGRRNRDKGDALFIIEDDSNSRTRDCAADTKDEFIRDFDVVYIRSDDDDARNGDVVAIIDRDTDCKRLWDDIDEELSGRHSTRTVYVYYGRGSNRYRNRGRSRSRRGYRLYRGGKRGRGRNRSRRWGGGWRRSWRGGGGRNRSWHGSGGGGHKRSWHGSGGDGHKSSWHGDKDRGRHHGHGGSHHGEDEED